MASTSSFLGGAPGTEMGKRGGGREEYGEGIRLENTDTVWEKRESYFFLSSLSFMSMVYIMCVNVCLCSLEGCDVQFSHEPKSSLVSSEHCSDVPPEHPMWASMWSGDVCNALNSSMKLAVMQQTSNTLIIDASLLGAVVLYQCANKMRNKWAIDAWAMKRRGGGFSSPAIPRESSKKEFKE